jgi:CheY-like chemotaxis protein
MKILIIDDDPDFVDAMSNLLEAKGYEIISAPDGEEGIEKAKSEKPNLLILDVMMTRKTEGFDVARTLQKNPETKGLPVILITGIKSEMNLPFGFEPDEEFLPVKAILEKPVKPEILLKTVEQHIKRDA